MLRCAVAAFLAGFGLVRLSAQDAIVGEIQWLVPPAPLEALPKRDNRIHLGYPDEFKNGDTLGYVIVAQSPDAAPGGKPSMMVAATHPPFARVVNEEFRHGNARALVYAQKNPPANAAIWQAFIFNPKSAGPKAREATPRLLAVAPVITNVRLGGAAQAAAWMKVSLDATGAIVGIAPEQPMPEPVLALVRAGMAQWKFAPARQAGQPVAADVVVPVISQGMFPSSAAPTADAVVHPHALGPPPGPAYTAALVNSGIRGEVTMEFEVEVDGSVVNATILRSSNPAFDADALRRLRAMKFAPGTRAGRPERMKSRLGLVFDPPDSRDAARVAPPSKKQMAKLPEEIRFDVAPRPRSVTMPVYPYALLRERVKGNAKAALSIDERGRVVHVEIVEATHPEFGQALLAAAERFEFEPALKAGRPVATIIAHQQEFRPYGFNQLPSDVDYALLTRETKKPETIVAAEKLDPPLKPISQLAPHAPLTAGGAAGPGHALVEFLVDETGHARLPRVIEASQPEYGYAATQAVAAWQFTAPRAAGKPAVVRVRVPFNFGPPMTLPPPPSSP